MKTHIITHSKDPDGILSHVLIRMHLGRERNFSYAFLDYPQLKDYFLQAELDSFSSIFLADLPLKERDISTPKLELLSQKVQLHYFDHHVTSRERFHLLSQLCYRFYWKKNICTSKIITEVLLPTDSYAKLLAEIAQAFDFEVPNQYFSIGIQLNRIINALTSTELAQITDCIIAQDWLSNQELKPPYRELHEQLLAQEKQAYQIVESTKEVHTIIDRKVALAYAPKNLYMKPGIHYLKKISPGCDGAILFFEQQANVVASSLDHKGETYIPILPFCLYQGGGGRNNAGGFILDEVITWENYAKHKQQVLASFRYFYHTFRFGVGARFV
ncbi:hypothetical protein MICAH_10006 [Microcystis aeruginosa PCC 9809]|jgi:oligoribonuclease NrnB/cAMP/cGMP phosphodiesterase (DHH superfamily)|uniref:DHHA1 domain-containing protein n=1 Tax=Microcystis aeruginosa PCC 9809 TaxID=1160285 RepID=I4HFX2_MICAE|nr:hypothetical protein [Microcystis aeruginosa]CCI20946.1 hypothetical protein MICAH_10006 [Microcystis aeruginosa PCC 9809]